MVDVNMYIYKPEILTYYDNLNTFSKEKWNNLLNIVKGNHKS